MCNRRFGRTGTLHDEPDHPACNSAYDNRRKKHDSSQRGKLAIAVFGTAKSFTVLNLLCPDTKVRTFGTDILACLDFLQINSQITGLLISQDWFFAQALQYKFVD